MKKTYYLYADLETTVVPLPDGYKNHNDYYKNHPNPKYPKIYDFNILYDKSYGKLINQNYNTDDELGVSYHYGISGEQFIKYISNIKVDGIMYFNNLKGFDGHFIVPLLDKMGYQMVFPFEADQYENLDDEVKIKWLDRIVKLKENILRSKKNREHFEELGEDKGNEWLAQEVKKRWDHLLEGEYKLMVNGNHQIYEIKIGLKSTKRTKGNYKHRVLIIRDNLLLFPTSVANMGKMLAEHHIKDGMDEDIANERYHKKDLSSGYTRTTMYKSMKELEEDGNELEYLIKDTYILYEYHKMMELYFERKHWKLTIASTSYSEWKRVLGDELLTKFMDNGLIHIITLERGIKRYVFNGKRYTTTKIYDVLINNLLPTEWLDEKINEDETVHQNIYNWYGGGLTLVNEDYRGRLVRNVLVLDINSSYPAQMVLDVLVPYGKGVKGNKKGYDFKLYTLTPKKDIKNTTGLPFVYNQFSKEREYLKTVKKGMEIKLNSIEYERFLEYYKCDKSDYKLKVEWSFKAIPIKKFFQGYIDKWYNIKENASAEGNEILKAIAKLFLNSLYGKFGSKSERVSKLWIPALQIWETIVADMKSQYYLPLALAITSLARMSLVDAIGHNVKYFVYSDTDSIFIRLDLVYKDYPHMIKWKLERIIKELFPNLDLNPDKLGAWDIEFENGVGVVRRSKQYYFKNNNKKKNKKIAFSGINFNRFILPDNELKELEELEKEMYSLSIMDYIVGKKIGNQVKPHRVVGYGILITDIEKTIKPIWDYKPLSQQIYYDEEHYKEVIEEIKKIS